MRRALITCLVGGLFALTAGCGISVNNGGSTAAASTGTTAPLLDSVDPLADPRTWQGPSSAVLGSAAVDPVVESPKQRLPVTLTDDQDTEVTVDDTSRVLALDVYGTLSRTVFELGLGDRLVGRDVSTQFDEATDLPLVTRGGHDLNAESILEMDPTLIITDTSLGPWSVILQMREAGVPVVVLDSSRNLGNVGTLIEGVAEAMGVPDAGSKLAERTADQIAATTKEIDRVAPGADTDSLRAVFLYVRGQSGVYYMFGEKSGADSLIDALGLYDVSGEIGWSGMKPVTDEAIIAAQPDVVLMMSDGLASADGVDGLLERIPALKLTPAGEKRRFVDMDDALMLGFGPLTAQVLNALAVAVYAPEAVS